MERTIRVGVIGLGAIAHVAQLPALSQMAGVEIVAALSRTAQSLRRAASRYNILRLCTSLEEFLDTEMDCAFVLTPKDTHTEFVLALLERGIDVFCEKPMAMSLAEAEQMVKTAEVTGRLLMIGFNRRYAPVYQKAKERYVDTRPDICLAEKNRLGTEYRATLENGIHMVDLMRWFCGEAVSVNALAQYTDPYYETSVTAQIQFNTGSIGVLIASRTAGQWVERVELYGGNLSVFVDSPDTVRTFTPKCEEAISMTPLAMGWARVEDKMGFRQEVEHFIECVRIRREPLTSGRDAYQTHVLIDWILREAGLPGLD